MLDKSSINGSLLSIPTDTHSSNSLPVPLEQIFSLDQVLSKSTQSDLITNYYQCNQNLNESCRNLLVDLIIARLLERKHSMYVVLASNIADTNVGTFTAEIQVPTRIQNYNCIILIDFNFNLFLKELYVTKDGRKKGLKGKLYSNYFNKLRSIKSQDFAVLSKLS